MHFELSASLECGGLAPLCYRAERGSGVVCNVARLACDQSAARQPLQQYRWAELTCRIRGLVVNRLPKSELEEAWLCHVTSK